MLSTFTFLGIITLVVLGILIYVNPRSQTLAIFRPLKRKNLHIATPHRQEMILLFLYVGLFLWFDIVKNQVISNGIDSTVEVIGGWTIVAFELATLLLILYHVVLVTIFVRSLRSKSTHRTYDVVIGTLALFGIAILLAGFVNEFYSETIRFFFIEMSSVTFYHIGVLFQIISATYFAFSR